MITLEVMMDTGSKILLALLLVLALVLALMVGLSITGIIVMSVTGGK